MIVKKPSMGHRARQAQVTKEQVASAARNLFAERGYVATTMSAIAAAAAVPAQTIYSAFGSKSAILEEIRRIWIDGSGVRQSHLEALDEPHQGTRLRMAAQWHTRQMELGYDVIAIYQEAARSDPAMAREWDRVQKSREGAIAALVGSIAPHLPARLDVTSATDLYVTITLPEVYRSLVIDRRWSLTRYEGWLADTLVAQLLD